MSYTIIMTNDINTPENENPAPTKTNPFDGMAEHLSQTLPLEPLSLPADAPEWRVMDPDAILGRQMLALDDLFAETLDYYHDRKDKPQAKARSTYLPLILKLQQNCLSTARTLTTMEYLESLKKLNDRAHHHKRPHPLPPVSDEQTIDGA